MPEPGHTSETGHLQGRLCDRRNPWGGSLVALTLLPETQFPIPPAGGDDTAPRAGQACEPSAAPGPGGPGNSTPPPPPAPCPPLRVRRALASPGRSACGALTAESRGRGRPRHPRRRGRGAGSPPVSRRSRTSSGVTRPARRPRLPVAGTRRSPPARTSRTTGPGLSPDGAPPQASPPCARSATSNSLHCPAPPRSRPSPSSQPFTPPNRQGRAQEGPAIVSADSAGRSGGATAAPGGLEPRRSRPRPRAARLRPAPPRGRGRDPAPGPPPRAARGPKARRWGCARTGKGDVAVPPGWRHPLGTAGTGPRNTSLSLVPAPRAGCTQGPHGPSRAALRSPPPREAPRGPTC